MEDQKRASVVMIRGSGDERLQQAIAQGLLQEEIADDVNDVLRQLQSLKRQLDTVKSNNDYLKFCETTWRKEQARYAKIYTDALTESMKRKNRKEDLSQKAWYAIIIGVAFLIVLVAAIIAGLIIK